MTETEEFDLIVLGGGSLGNQLAQCVYFFEVVRVHS